MIISKIHLSNFRNFQDKVLVFSPKTTVLVGPNASGKTNVLEAIFLLATGKSFRARVEEEMIDYEEEISRIRGIIRPKTNLEIVLTRGEIGIGTARSEKVARKRLLINGVGKRLIDFAGNFKLVLFGPWDLHLITESPSIRRKFLDTVLSQVDREYRRASLSYDKGVRQRNRLLYRIREEGLSHPQLLFWNRLLIKNGDYISKKREEFISFVNQTGSLNEQVFKLDYDKSAISEVRLEQYRNEEIAAATTLVGPHRDDFCFRLKKRNLARYGSRGEQRMGVLWLKLAELAFVEKIAEQKPTLLLDDIFSELDHEHREVVMETAGNQQTIITTADPHFVKGLKKVEKIELKG
jgi:DNA replication and repair protein RecF